MSTTELQKIANKNASETARSCDLEDDARTLLTADLNATQYLDKLQEGGLYVDAARFLATALPKREAVWWACVCARSALGDETPEPKVTRALEAAEAWVYKPNEENRRPTEKLAEEATYEQPAAWAAIAAFWSGGSITAEGQPVVQPGDGSSGSNGKGSGKRELFHLHISIFTGRNLLRSATVYSLHLVSSSSPQGSEYATCVNLNH